MTHTAEVTHRRNLIGALLFFLVAFCGAHAATIKFGNSFSVSIDSPSARVCVIFPESMRDREGCAGLNLSNQSQPSSDAIIGVIRFNDNGVPAKATLAITREPDSPHTWLTRDDAVVTANTIAQTVAGRQHASVSSLQVDIRDEITPNMVRLSYNLDGLSDQVRPFMGHQITYLVWSSEAFYSIAFETGPEHAAAIDAIADASARTVMVAYPKLINPITPQMFLAPVFWILYAVVILLGLPLASRRRKPLATALPCADAQQTPAGPLDVSIPAALRKRIGRAAVSLKFVGPFSGVFLVVFLSGRLKIASVLLAIAVLVCTFAAAKRLRAGHLASALFASLVLLGWSVFVLFTLIDTLRRTFDFFALLGGVLFVLPIFFLASGLAAFFALRRYQHAAASGSDPLAGYPWEKGPFHIARPHLMRPRGLRVYLFLLLAPLPYLYVWATAKVSTGHGAADVAGQYTASVVIAILALMWGTRIYRRARRQAMVPGSELVQRDPRPPVLYLRSFRDDTGLRLRSRATDGRILPEKLLKVSFEELITDHLWGYGPVLAIGSPRDRDKLSPLGAARDYATDETWRDTAISMMQRPWMIAAIPGATEGIGWEMNMIVSLGFLAKLVLVLPPTKPVDLRARWEILRSGTLGAILPQQIDLSRTRAIVFPEGRPLCINGTKSNDWTYETTLDEAALVIAAQRLPAVRETN